MRKGDYEPLMVRSNELRICVTEPEGIDREAYKLLRSAPAYEERGVWLQEPEQFEELLARSPRSRYAIYAKFSLAVWHNAQRGGSDERGTERSVRESEAAARLEEAVAEEAGDTPLGLHAKRCAGKHYAMAGKVALGQRLLEEAFLAPTATDGDRVRALSWLVLLHEGYWQTGRCSKNVDVGIRLPLRRFCEALGFSITWDQASGMASVSGPRLQSTLDPATGRLVINGEVCPRADMAVEEGILKVSPYVIGALVGYHDSGVAGSLAGPP